MKNFITYCSLSVLVALFACNSSNNEQQEITRTIVATTSAPVAIGPYSQAILAGNTLYCSGQIAINPETGEQIKEDIQAETQQVLKNLSGILESQGMDFGDVVKATVYLKDINDYAAMNSVYESYFTKSPPARAAVQVARLPKDASVEISLIAVNTSK